MVKKVHMGWLIALVAALAMQWLSAAAPELEEVDPAVGCGGEPLSQPGHYILTRDLECSGAVNGIVITASDVVLHLAGHTISNATCDVNEEVIGIFVTGGLTNVTIEGGTVSGFNDGISLSSSHSTVTGMTVTGACFYGILAQAADNVIERNVVTASGYGVGLVPATGTSVRWNDLSGNAIGVQISDEGSDNNVVEYNIISHNNLGAPGTGVQLANGTGNTVQHNAINYNYVGVAVHAPGNTVRANTVSASGGTGITIDTNGGASTVQENTVLGSAVVDMADDTAECGANTWQNNTFQTDTVLGVPDGGPAGGCIR